MMAKTLKAKSVHLVWDMVFPFHIVCEYITQIENITQAQN